MSKTRRDTVQQSATPRAVVHKNILDAAINRPDASMEELADEIAGATVSLVERVLEEYGDPGVDSVEHESPQSADQENTAANAEDPMRGTDGQHSSFPVADSDLTEKQRETLRAIQESPEATQAELADILGVTPATINTRVNTIESFDWERRHEFVDQVLGDGSELIAPGRRDENGESPAEEPGTALEAAEGTGADLGHRMWRLEAQVRELQANVESDSETRCPIADDAELAHKVLHACLHSDRMSEEEELALLEALVSSR